MGRTIIIGDVHGMLLELNALLKAVAPAPGDTLVSTGDLVHKGPGSVAVVRRMRELGAVLVMGNHEEKQARFRKALAATGDVSKIKMKGVEEMATIEAALSPEDIDYLESARLFVRLPEHNAVVVHAGFLPETATLPSDDEWAAMSKGDREKFARVMRVRHVTAETQAKVTVEFSGLGFDPEMKPEQGLGYQQVQDLMEGCMAAVVVKKEVRPKGSFISLGQERLIDPFWAEVYDGRFGKVYFGHQPYAGCEAPRTFPHAVGLDLGCVFGGRLAAVVLEAGKPERVVTMEAHQKYADSLWED